MKQRKNNRFGISQCRQFPTAATTWFFVIGYFQGGAGLKRGVWKSLRIGIERLDRGNSGWKLARAFLTAKKSACVNGRHIF